jgi:hypothetical protein
MEDLFDSLGSIFESDVTAAHDAVLKGVEKGLTRVTEGGIVRVLKDVPVRRGKVVASTRRTRSAAPPAVPQALAAKTPVTDDSDVAVNCLKPALRRIGSDGVIAAGTIVGVVDPVSLMRTYEKRATAPTVAGAVLSGTFTLAKLALPVLATNPITALPFLVGFGALAIAETVRRSLNKRSAEMHGHIGAVHADLARRVDGVQSTVVAAHADLAHRVDGVQSTVVAAHADLARRVDGVQDTVVAAHADLARRVDGVQDTVVAAHADLAHRIGNVQEAVTDGFKGVHGHVGLVHMDLALRITGLHESVVLSHAALDQRITVLQESVVSGFQQMGDSIRALQAEVRSVRNDLAAAAITTAESALKAAKLSQVEADIEVARPFLT